MSIGEFAVNTVFSFALGFVATDASNKISQKIELKIQHWSIKGGMSIE